MLSDINFCLCYETSLYYTSLNCENIRLHTMWMSNFQVELTCTANNFCYAGLYMFSHHYVANIPNNGPCCSLNVNLLIFLSLEFPFWGCTVLVNFHQNNDTTVLAIYHETDTLYNITRFTHDTLNQPRCHRLGLRLSKNLANKTSTDHNY